jgi:hypothetical protein
MFQLIDGAASNVVAVRATGKVTAQDYATVLAPAVAKATAGGRKARLLYELGADFGGYEAGAVLADAKLGIADFAAFEKIAVVTDVDWIRHSIRLFGPLIPGDVRVFALSDMDAAHAWISA